MVLYLAVHCCVAFLPWWLKNPLYRLVFGYRIGKRVRIGISPLAVRQCDIADDVRIGYFNLFWKTECLIVEDHVRIGHFNVFRGGRRIHLQRYAEIFRGNVINSIPEPDAETQPVPEFRLGAGSVVTTSHWIDFTDYVTVGARSIIGGRHSSFWTHSRQWTRPIRIGSFVYLGSEVRLAPGASVPSFCVVGLGSVIVDAICAHGFLIAGNPARPVKTLDAHGLRLLTRKTRPDLPEDIGGGEPVPKAQPPRRLGEILESAK